MKAVNAGDSVIDLMDIPRKQRYTVSQHNDLIQRARHELTTKELKLVDFMVSKIKPQDNELFEVKTSIQEINEVMDFGRGGEQYRDTAEALLNLRNKGFFIEMTDNKDYGDKKPIVTTSWLGKAQINPDNTCILKLDKDLVPYLLNLVNEGHFTQFYLREILSLKSKYSLMLYRLAKSYGHVEGFGDTVEEFKKYFGKENLTWNQFNQKYLKPSIKEVNEKTLIDLTLKTKRNGRSISDVYILIEDKEKKMKKSKQEQENNNSNTDKPKVPLYNWLEGYTKEQAQL